MAGAGRTQVRQRRAQHVPSSDDLHVEHEAHVGVGGLLDGAEESVAGVVDDDVEAAEAVDGLGDGLLDRGRVDEVDLERQQAGRVGAVEGGEQALGRPGRGRDAVAAPQQGGDEGEAEAARGAGDEPGGGTVGGVGHGGFLS